VSFEAWVNIDQAGHAVMSSRTAPRFRAAMSLWLRQRGF
jgi:hypothetical protein